MTDASVRFVPSWVSLLGLLAVSILAATSVVLTAKALHMSEALEMQIGLATQDIGGILCYVGFARRNNWPLLRDYFSPVPLRTTLIAIAVAIVVKALFAGLGELLSALGIDFPVPPADSLMADSVIELAWVLPVAALLAPVWEELFCRGLLLDRLRRYMPAWMAVLLSSLLFVLAHDNFLNFGMTGVLVFSERFTIGAIAALMTLRFRSLMPAFLFHAACNTIAETSSALIPS